MLLVVDNSANSSASKTGTNMPIPANGKGIYDFETRTVVTGTFNTGPVGYIMNSSNVITHILVAGNAFEGNPFANNGQTAQAVTAFSGSNARVEIHTNDSYARGATPIHTN